MLFYIKIHVKIAPLFIILRNFQVKFLHSFCNDSLELSYIQHRSNNHDASASTLLSDSVATLDSGHVHFILFRLPDGPAASASSHKQQHQVRVLIDAIISLTVSQAAFIAMPSFKSNT